jgi:hypothetical protein
MTEEEPKSFGKRGAPPVITHRPGAGANGVIDADKITLAATLVFFIGLGGAMVLDWIDRKLHCEDDPANSEQLICKEPGSGAIYHRSNKSSSSSSSHSASSSTEGVSFGGFGHYGYHSGGG